MSGDDDDIGSLAWVARMEAQSKPMTRTELAMLWDGLGRWLDSHGIPASASPIGAMAQQERLDAALILRSDIDAELTERFGG